MTSQYATSPTGLAQPAPDRDTSADARILAELRQPGGRPVLIKGAVILSQDPAVGDYAPGDLLIRDGKIAQVGENLAGQTSEAVVIDAAGTIAVPGFVDAHVHAWEGQLRGTAPTLDFGGYLSFTAFGYGPHYRPQDNYIGTLATALVALDAGIATIIDEMGSHIDNVADVLTDLDAKGLLTSDHAFNHCNALPGKTWELIKRSGAAVNLAPRSDAAFGLGSGFPPSDQARAAGLVPGLSGDNEISYALSMFTEMQTLLNKHRGSVFGRVMAGEQNPPDQLAPSDVLRFATLGGAANAGLSHKAAH